jgi:hypothetical protein
MCERGLTALHLRAGTSNSTVYLGLQHAQNSWRIKLVPTLCYRGAGAGCRVVRIPRGGVGPALEPDISTALCEADMTWGAHEGEASVCLHALASLGSRVVQHVNVCKVEVIVELFTGFMATLRPHV